LNAVEIEEAVSKLVEKAIVVEFLQNAIIWSAADGTPQLILLR